MASKGATRTGASSCRCGDQNPVTLTLFVGFRRARFRIDQPGEGDAVTGIARQLDDAILARGEWR